MSGCFTVCSKWAKEAKLSGLKHITGEVSVVYLGFISQQKEIVYPCSVMFMIWKFSFFLIARCQLLVEMLHCLAAGFYYSFILLQVLVLKKSYNLNGYKFLYKCIIFIELKQCGGKHSFEICCKSLFRSSLLRRKRFIIQGFVLV